MGRARAPARILPRDDPDKARRVDEEYSRLRELFKDADENKLAFVDKQIHQLAWLNISIVDLQMAIDETGTSLAYQNGASQTGHQVNPDCKLLIEYQKLANTVFRSLIAIVPEKLQSTKFRDFMDSFDCD